MSEGVFEGYRLSPQQDRLWFLCGAGEVSAYRAQCMALIEGNINSELFQAAVNRVIARHEILRTNLGLVKTMSVPVQVISESACSVVAEINLASLSEQEKAGELELLYELTRPARTNCNNGSPLEVLLVRVSDNRQVMMVSTDSMWSDKRGLKNIIRAVIREYEGKTREGEPDMQYADVSEIFNKLMESEETKAGREYWGRRTELKSGEMRLVFE